MKKLFKRILKIALLAFVAAILTIIIIVLFPQRLFANKMEYKILHMGVLTKVLSVNMWAVLIVAMVLSQ
jgi:hypothetical protein